MAQAWPWGGAGQAGWLGLEALLTAASRAWAPLPADVTQYLLFPKWLGEGLCTIRGSLSDQVGAVPARFPPLLELTWEGQRCGDPPRAPRPRGWG